MPNLTSPSQLWRALQNDAGLEIRRKRNVPGRDADIEVALKAALGLSGDPSPLEACLDKDAASPPPAISIETFLVALLTSQQGYAGMMRDMLDLLVQAGATRDSRSMGVEFRFDDVSEPLRYTLEAFREAVERVEKVLDSRFELPPSGQLWELREVLMSKGAVPALSSPPADFPAAPALPATGHPVLDAMLEAIAQLVKDFRTLCSGFGATRGAAYHAVSGAGAGADDRVKGQVGAATDYWDVQVANMLQQLASRVIARALDADDLVSALQPQLDRIELRRDWVARTYRELLDSLQLPTWRKRHELFSVWAGSVLLRTARAQAESFHYHVINGVLSFAFGGSRLATYVHGGEQFDIWAELRSALVGSSTKRKKGIQPDFRVLRPAMDTTHNAATRLVLECKHYLAPSISNFSAAAKDYAGSCPTAEVFVVNHGVIDHPALIASVAAQDRIQFLGSVTVENERLSRQLGDALKRALFPMPPLPPAAPRPLAKGAVASIRLRWDGTLADMDLALDIEQADGSIERIDFSSQGDLLHHPYACLERDMREGPGEERIDIGAWHGKRYTLVATNFTGTGELGPEHLACSVTIGSDHTEIPCPPLGTKSEWRIAVIDVVDGGAVLTP